MLSLVFVLASRMVARTAARVFRSKWVLRICEPPGIRVAFDLHARIGPPWPLNSWAMFSSKFLTCPPIQDGFWLLTHSPANPPTNQPTNQVMEAVATARVRFLAARSPPSRGGRQGGGFMGGGNSSPLSPHQKLSTLCLNLLQRDWSNGDMK